MLTYHAVNDASAFSCHLRWLRNEASLLTLRDAIDVLRGDVPPPERAVLVTLDDGDRSVYETAAPLMTEVGVPGVAFVVAGLVDTCDPCWWTEVRALAGPRAEDLLAKLKAAPNSVRLETLRRMRASADGSPVQQAQLRRRELASLEGQGIDIGCHSLTHPCLDRCTVAEIEIEVVVARSVLTDLLGHEATAYAYPNGSLDSRSRSAVERAGYTIAFGYDGQRAATPAPDLFSVSRVKIEPWEPVSKLAAVVTG